MGEILAQGRLKDDEAGICTAFLHGYSLNKRLWGYFPVEHAKEVEWMPNSFDRLILSPRPKQAIMALVKSYINTPPSTLLSDLVRGKGLGMIFLLHGPPGVGKTLTAGTYFVPTNLRDRFSMLIFGSFFLCNRNHRGGSPAAFVCRWWWGAGNNSRLRGPAIVRNHGHCNSLESYCSDRRGRCIHSKTGFAQLGEK